MKLPGFFLVLLSSALVTVLGLQQRAANKLRNENTALVAAAEETKMLKVQLAESRGTTGFQDASNEIARLREENRDLLKLRNEVRASRERKDEFERLRAENERLRSIQQTASSRRSEKVVFRTIHFSRNNLSNQGLLTPEAAVQTFFWAKREGNVSVLGSCIRPERLDGRNISDGLEIAQWFAQSYPAQTTFQIVARRDVRAGLVELGISVRTEPGEERKIAITLQLTGSEWKLHVDPYL
jgi:hypothetical protein